MLTQLESIGVIVAVVLVVLAAVFLRRFIGGVEDTMAEMTERDREVTPPRPIRPPKTRRRR